MQKLYKALLLIIVCSVFAVKSAFSQCTLTGLNSSYCVDDASVTLSGGTAYYGPGVTGGVFYPSIAGVSTRPHKIFTTNGVATGYTVSTTGTYYPYTLSSSALSIANSSSSTVAIGFNFVYFGITYANVGLFDNGFIKLGGGGATSATAQLIPTASTPNTEIAFAWNDLDPSTGTIRYQVFGSAPLRVFVAEYANVQFMGGGDYVTVQVHLFETSNHIEIHSTHNGSIGINKTMGIENSTGGLGVSVPGRNRSVWTANNDFVSFTPSCTVVKDVNVYALPNAALTVSPASTSICPSNTVNVTIGSSELGVNYQLLNNADNSALSGTFAGTGGNLVITSSALASSTVVKVRATNATTSCDVDLTNVSNVTVNVPPQINVQPTASQTVCVGQSVTFSVNAGVTTSPTYQWKKGGVDIAGATSSSYTIASVVTGDAATYTVSVGGTCTPAVLSSNAVLNVNTLPAITTQPTASQTVCEGSAVSFTVAATGTSLSYQWKKNGIDIAGATSATYTIATTVTADAATYTVVVSGTCSPSVTSNGAVLIINEQPEIITQPAATQTVCVGQSVTFSVNAGVTTSPTYQWKKGGVDIAGATSSSYTIASVVVGDAATYTVSVGGTCTPAVLSSNAVLNVNALPAITTQPSASQTVCEGSAVSFTVAATGTSLTYQWKKNGVDIVGATSATYTIATTVTADAATYTVVVSGTCSPSVTSSGAVLNINEKPEIITQPTASQTVCVGQSVTFSVSAGVTTSPTYQWKKGGVDIAGATSSSYTIASVVVGDAATYTVSVGGTCTPAVLSSNAVLNVNTLPAITSQPTASQTVCEGSAVSFTVVATGTSLTYQWKKNGVDIVGATSATYTIATTVTADAATYTVVVSGTCSPSVTSSGAVLNINEKPEIITQPTASQTVCVGQSVTFSVNAGVTTSPTYQWKKGGVDIAGATSSSYTIASVTTSDAATYTVSVGGTCTPVVLSSNAVLNVNTLPAITSQPPASQTVCEGSAVSFTVAATGTSLTYQWKKNGVDIVGATSATYTIATTVTADAATYTVVVSGACSPSVTSNGAVLNINEQPEIITQPAASQTVCVGQSVTFSVNAGVTTSPTYQWKKGGVDIAGATSSSYTIASVTTSDAATYTVSVGGTCTPAVLSSNAVLNVNTLPAITTQPSASQTVCEGSAVSFTVAATGTSLTYQWKKNGVDIAGATSATYTIATTVTADAATYTVVVSGTCSPSVTSSGAVLNINEKPEIITQPTATQTVCVGQSVTFSVNAGVTTSPTYQWKKGGVDIAGATSSSYTIASVVAGDAATYTVSVGGTCTPAVLSSNAVLNVNTLPAITSQPTASQTVCEGSAVSFTVAATGTSLTYQWKKNGVDIVGATSATYSIATTVTADAATYTVVVSGTCSPSVTSSGAVLNINEKPEIITQPTATQTVCVGQSVTFSVNAGVTTSPTYQWKKGGVDIAGATSSSYTIASVVTGDAATYTVSVGGTCTPAVLSSNAVLNVNTLPAITTQPTASQTVCEGSAVSFTVAATGTSLTYQWKKNGVDIVGATSATYTIATTVTADAATYTVVVSGTCSPSVTSSGAVLNINEQPEIITQPAATQTVCVGQSVTFSVNAGVTTSPTYQWKKGGVDIAGATSSSYTIASVVAGDAATYTVSVGGTCTPAVLSSNAVLNVNTLPAITSQPTASQTVCEGSAVSFTVAATGTSLTYQWKKNGVDIVGATSATYTIATTVTADAATYTVVVSGTCSPSVTSNGAVLNINEKPEIITQPAASQTVCVGQSVTFSVNAGVTTSPTYQWKKGGVDIAGGTSSSYTIASVVAGDAATYTVSVGGTCTPAVLSSNAVLNVNTLPAITSQPTASQTVCEGSAVSFTVVASGTGVTYQWKKNGVDIAGATSATYTIATTVTADAATYTVVVSGTCSPSVTSSGAVLNINEQPEIITQPIASQTVCVGQSVTFSVNAGVTTSPTYQWKKGGVDIAGATSSSYTIASVTTSDAATYTVSVGGTCTPAVVSSNAVLNVNTLPAITSQPTASQTVCEGSAVSFTVAATGTSLTYQWKKNGVDIAGATSATYTIATTVTADAATYTVVVSGTCSPSVTSSGAVLNINEQPEIITQPTASQTVCVGQSVTFSVNAGVTTSPTYQWKKGGVDIAGATSSSYTIASVTTSDAATYTVSVGGTCTPAVLSSNAVLNVNTLPAITTQPTASQTVCEGSAVSFTVAATGTSLTYQWKKNGVDIVGATSATYSIATTVTADAATYTVVVSGTCSPSVTSSGAVLNINEKPEIITQPAASQTVCVGQSVTFSVNAGVTTSPTYQWKKGGVDIAGATSSSYTIASVVVGDAATYTVSVGGTCTPAVVSSNAVLNVNTLPAITSQPTASQTVCEGSAVSFTVAATGTSLTYQWKKNGVDIAGATSATYTIATTVTADAATYTVVVSGTCSPSVTSSGAVLNINEKPEIITQPTATQTVCVGQSVTFSVNAGVTTSPTYQWKKGGVDIAGATSSSYTIASVTTSDAATYTVSVGGTCTPAVLSSNAVLNVNVPPTSFASPETICSGQTTNVAITNPNSVSGTVFNWTIQASNNVTGALPGSATIIAQSLSSTDGITQGSVTYQIIGSAAGCSGPPFAVTVTVNPIPNASASDNIICSGSSANIALVNPNGVANTSFSWTVSSSSNVTGAGNGSGSLINQILTSTDGTSNGFVIYSVTPSAGGCSGTPITVRVDVKPVPVITTPSSSLSPQICSNETLSFIPTSTIPGTTTYTWTSTISGPISAASITTSGSGTISDTPINTGNISGIVTYHITPHLNGCDGVPVDYVVTVKPLPSATASNVIICSGQNAVISILPSPKNVSGTTFVWTASASTNVTGASDGSGSLINQTLSTTNSLVGNVTYFITPTASGCSIAPVSVTATVNPIATVDAGADRNVCEPSTILVTGFIGGSATSGTWSVVSGAGTISSSTTTGTTVTATYTVMPGDIAGSVIFKLTTDDPDGSGLSGPCSSVSDNLQIDVHKQAKVTVPADYTVCEPSQISLSGTLAGSATSGSWTLLSGAGTLTVSSVTGSNVTASYFPDATDVTNTVTFRLTTNDPDGSGLCGQEFADLNVTINRSAKVDAGADFEVCEDKIVQLNGSYSGTTSVVTWTGGSGASQFSDIHDPQATYTLTAADITAGTVTLTLTTNDPDGSGASGPCNPVSDQVTFKINKLPQPQIVGLKPIYAENDPIVTLVGFSSNSSGGTGVFTGPGILAGTNQFDPATSGTGLITITFTFTDNKTCVGVTTANTIVNPVTSVDFDVADSAGTVIFQKDGNGYPLVCANQGIVELVGTPKHNDPNHQLPTGFAAVSSQLITRLDYDAGSDRWLVKTNGLSAGNYSIMYTYTNEFGATNTIIKDIVVLSAPLAVIDVGNNCIDNAVQFTESSYVPNNLSGATIVNWNWLYGEDLNGSNGAIQEPFYSYSNAGTHNVQLKVTTDQGCSNLASKSIIIGVKPKPDFTWSSFCQGDTTRFINKSTSTFGVIDKYGWDFKDGDTLGISTATKAIPPGKHSGRTFGVWSDPQHTFQNFKAYRVKLWVGTNAGCIDTLSKRVVILDFTAPLPTSAYFNNFEAGPGTWFAVSNTANDTLESWSFGTPNGDRIDHANSGVNAWWTGKNKDALLDKSSYFKNENSYVVGPCLDLTALERPMISLDYWADTQIGFDGAVVQYSMDGGATWETIGDAQGGGINWYNQRDLLSQPGDQDNFAWSDTLSNWINARYNLDKIPEANRDKVVLRVAFASNNDNPNERVLNGLAFDNIYIGEKKRTVMVEHFVNNADVTDSEKIDQLFDDQTNIPPKKEQSDFFKIEYHLDIPNNEDTINMVSPYDSRVRALYYGVGQPPYSIMDGITGSYFDANFNGDLTYFTREEFDRRALEDPLFDIQVNTAGSTIDRLKASIDVTYLDSLNALDNSVVVYTALVEGNIGSLHNVVKKLLPTNAGFILKGPWDTSRPKETMNIDYSIDVHITNPDSLYLVVFVQNNSFDTNSGMSRMIHQATKIKLNKMVGPVVTGLPDNPAQVEIHGIKIYPNPAKNTLFFGSDVKLDKSYTWELVDQRGVSVLNGQLAQDLRVSQQIDISSLANGIYFVKIGTTKGSVIYKKIAIVNGY